MIKTGYYSACLKFNDRGIQDNDLTLSLPNYRIRLFVSEKLKSIHVLSPAVQLQQHFPH